MFAMKKGTLFLLCSTMLLLGTVAGFLLAPVKAGLSIGSNNNNHYGGVPSEGGGESAETNGSGDDIPF